MPKITKVYTRQGDLGGTQLSSGERVAKNNPRVTAVGTVDELNSHIGLALALDLQQPLVGPLTTIQNDLFHLGSDLSFRGDSDQERLIPQIEKRHIEKLEQLIDELNAAVGPLLNFILPGGVPGAAQLHIARTVCRRAEREVITLMDVEPVGDHVVAYLNRLSDLLFVMARYENWRKGRAESLWDSTA